MNFANIESTQQLQSLITAIRAGKRVVSIAGLGSGAKALVIAALQKATGKRFAFLSLRNRDLEDLERDLRFFYCTLNGLNECEEQVFTLPASESNPYSGTSPHAELLERRALALWRLASGTGDIVMLTARSLMQRFVPPQETKQATVTLRVGEELPLGDVLDHLHAVGYVRSDPVGNIGEYSLRGGILDFYAPSSGGETLYPFRVEFFGDEIDSVREFDPETQRSLRQVDEAVIVPMRDERSSAQDFKNWAHIAREHWHDEKYDRALRDRLVFAEEGEPFPGWEYLLPLVKPLTASVFDYLRDAVLVVDEPSETEKQVKTILDELQLNYQRAEDADDLALLPEKLFLTPDELSAKLERLPRIELRLLGSAALGFEDELSTEDVSANSVLTNSAPEVFTRDRSSSPLFLFPPEPNQTDIELISRAVRKWHGRLSDLADELKTRDDQTIFVLPTTGIADRIREALNDYDVIVTNAAEGLPTTDYRLPTTLLGDLSVGFSLPAANLTFYTERDIFDEAIHVERRTGKAKAVRSQAAAFLSDFRDLKIGDYVVHIDHGIGQFQGLFQLDTSGGTTAAADNYARAIGAATQAKEAKREFMLLTYAEGTKLYVPVERLDLVQKFSSGESTEPKLDKLGGIAWAKTKAKAKRAMRDMAEELLKLYAERKLAARKPFSPDSHWQEEFEASFPYELTPDQVTAVADVKRSMEEPMPMDRLLCGDVGYGKTEVAMRAAFKAVMDGKQVALLAPTTVLAYQHYQTFKSRFAAFPVTIDLLSRFRSPKEQKEVVEAIEQGKVDIIVGTHRILSRDMVFKDLGLVIVDEEQRFGVAHKERLKQLKKRVDVLTMSATPIPRTLNMSLMGLRDMSVIETPPRDRLAIQTNVMPFSEQIIRAAIEQELQREGQVFFVHNRVESIDEVAALVKRIVPQARIVVAHGQMGEKEMEQAVLDFVAYKFDVLVATTIIENGIDIPRANTIIINRADTYGLSQLYQLRGRVGRSNRRAYAYLLIPGEAALTPIARKRLAAIREFSDLGAGFRIAALDLELRGGGNLLGGQQSGHIDAIGFDLYCQMLERTVNELRGEDIVEEVTTQLNLGVDTRIPDEYINDMSQRLRTYKRIASARDDSELAKIKDEIADRYGRLPESVENLFAYAKVRREAEGLGFLAIDRIADSLSVRLSQNARINPEAIVKLLAENPNAKFTPNGVLKVRMNEEENLANRVFGTLSELLRTLAK
ncbi:MAG TPA: transcription-repair coupling factor [Blastocatellia bacterium]|nr:transcription-repair coupling factor [Blastocatellia bacterium]